MEDLFSRRLLGFGMSERHAELVVASLRDRAADPLPRPLIGRADAARANGSSATVSASAQPLSSQVFEECAG